MTTLLRDMSCIVGGLCSDECPSGIFSFENWAYMWGRGAMASSGDHIRPNMTAYNVWKKMENEPPFSDNVIIIIIIIDLWNQLRVVELPTPFCRPRCSKPGLLS